MWKAKITFISFKDAYSDTRLLMDPYVKKQQILVKHLSNLINLLAILIIAIWLSSSHPTVVDKQVAMAIVKLLLSLLEEVIEGLCNQLCKELTVLGGLPSPTQNYVERRFWKGKGKPKSLSQRVCIDHPSKCMLFTITLTI